MTQTQGSHLTPAERLAEFRLKIIGSLLASPPKKGDLYKQLRALSKKTWIHPITGHPVCYGRSTIERWYYKVKGEQHQLLKHLSPSTRSDYGLFKSLNQMVKDAIEKQYHQHENWSVQLHVDNLLVRIEQEQLQEKLPSYSSILRYMRRQGFVQKSKRCGPKSPGAVKAAKRLEQREVRSYEIDYLHGLWHLDFHHGSLPVLKDSGEWVTPLLLAIMDDRSRLICHLQWYYQEDTETLVHGFCQALQKRAVPRSLMTDNGSAMVSAEFTRGLLELGIEHRKTLPHSAYQNGKQETFWANVEGRLLAMIEGMENLSLRQLNQYTQAWVEGDYHHKINAELSGQSPMDCYLNHPDNVGRDCPDSKQLRQFFTQPITRKLRRSDGTISVDGKRFEIPGAYHHLSVLKLRYARWDLTQLNLIDPNSCNTFIPIYPLNKSANANSFRRKKENIPAQQTVLPFAETPPYLQKLMNDYVSTGLPSAYIPKDEQGNS
jgi:putative transposase